MGKSYASAILIPVKEDELDKILKFQKAQLGKGYNWFGAIKLGFLELFSLNGKFRIRHTIDLLIILFGYVLVKYF